ncbi:MAG: GerAB/ArcD/ProY family transporter [Clostridia bacterium]|nr:GerAB/ArcD/ProY family transporter [Clostridia bacterium]
MKRTAINARQLGFFLAFLLPVGKLSELPSLLSGKVGGDLLLPAFLGLTVEFLSLFALFSFTKKTGMGPLAYAEKKNAKLGRVLRVALAAVLLVYSLPFLLDLEKFCNVTFSDTEPTFFSFAPFFILCGFICTKGIKAVGRSADLCPVLFFLPFAMLTVLAFSSADLSSLLPVFEKPLFTNVATFFQTAPFFSSGLLFLPLFDGYHYHEGDEKKIFPLYFTGAAAVLLFLALFYGLYGPLAVSEHYAITKIGMFFPALSTLGRTDLFFVYLITVVLFFFTALPVQLAVGELQKGFQLQNSLLLSTLINLALFFAVLFLNRRYNTVYPFFIKTLAPLYLVVGFLLPLLVYLGILLKRRGQVRVERRNKHAR